MILPRIPSATEIFEAACGHILRQHSMLRQDLHRSIATAAAAARGDDEAVRFLPSVIIMLTGELTNHMAYEESVLIPVLRGLGPAGADRAAAIKREHGRQREEFEAMFSLAGNHDDASGLALALQTLIADVLADMVEEETMLANERTLVEAVSAPHT